MGATTLADDQLADEHIAELAVSVSRLMHVFNRARAHMLDKARYDVEWTAQLVISTLVSHGPMRAGALAEALHSDPSTISRQVASLVRDGMIERRADPEDGRASLLVATDTARAAHEHHLGTRVDHFRAMLSGWNDGDCRQLAALLARFTDDFDTYKSTLSDGPWPRSGPREEQS